MVELYYGNNKEDCIFPFTNKKSGISMWITAHKTCLYFVPFMNMVCYNNQSLENNPICNTQIPSPDIYRKNWACRAIILQHKTEETFIS